MRRCCSTHHWKSAGARRPGASASTCRAWPITRDTPDMTATTVLGFDVGARRIGVAVGSALGSGARPVAVVDVHASGPDWPAIDRLVREWRPDAFVVGDPMTLDGGDQPIRKRAHAFARELARKFGKPVVLVEE